MARHRRGAHVKPPETPRHVRVLRDGAELAEAEERAAESQRRLRERLDARAAREAWMVERSEQRLPWRRFLRAGAREGAPQGGRSSGEEEAATWRHPDGSSRSPAA